MVHFRDVMHKIQVVWNHLEVLNLNLEDDPMDGLDARVIFLPREPQKRCLLRQLCTNLVLISSLPMSPPSPKGVHRAVLSSQKHNVMYNLQKRFCKRTPLHWTEPLFVRLVKTSDPVFLASLRRRRIQDPVWNIQNMKSTNAPRWIW